MDEILWKRVAIENEEIFAWEKIKLNMGKYGTLRFEDFSGIPFNVIRYLEQANKNKNENENENEIILLTSSGSDELNVEKNGEGGKSKRVAKTEIETKKYNTKTNILNQNSVNSIQGENNPITSCKRLRIEYIRKQPDIRSEIINKIEQIKKIQKKNNQIVKNLEHYRTTQISRQNIENKIIAMFIIFAMMLCLVLDLFTIFLTIQIEKKMKRPLWIFYPVFFYTLFVIIIFFCIYYYEGSKALLLKMYKFEISLFLCFVVLVVLIVLKLSHPSMFKWIIIIIPLLLMAIIQFYILSKNSYVIDSISNVKNTELSVGLSVILQYACSIIFFVIFSLVLFLQLDHLIDIKWEMAFTPLFIFDGVSILIPIVFSLVNRFYHEEGKSLLFYFTYIILNILFIVPWVLFETFLILYIKSNVILYFKYVMIPIFVQQVILTCLSCILCWEYLWDDGLYH
ncbi:fam11a [Anaeramoeba flamelloides]|uniref:Fam11a n=1 Tax=Anaeramoeba flamelloides TaxID=1746091 RepID=A0ABQ8YCE3_9EUKA|nr:fam11a [Anaeramoeba flamelloides]